MRERERDREVGFRRVMVGLHVEDHMDLFALKNNMMEEEDQRSKLQTITHLGVFFFMN